MKKLIRHLVKENLENIVSKSYIDCHCKGLDSIMLLDSPEQTIRLFVSNPGSEMYKNNRIEDLSISFHSHHCNISLMPITIGVRNWVIGMCESNNNSFELYEYKFDSKITGNGEFIKTDNSPLFETLHRWDLKINSVYHMNAMKIHTVHCSMNMLTAWFVFEGKEDRSYDGLCYTKRDLTRFSFDNLYRPMNEIRCVETLKRLNIL